MDYLNQMKQSLTSTGDAAKQSADAARQTIANTGESIRQAAASGTNVATDQINGVKESLGNAMNDFSSKAMVNAGPEFLSSNGIVAKFAFMVVILIAFMLLFNLGVAFLAYMMGPKTSPYVVKGMLNGSSPQTVTQDPSQTDSVVIYRSNNKSSGAEFTWSVWLFVNAIKAPHTITSSETDLYQHIFNKGNGQYKHTTADKGIATVNNAPGLYLDEATNAIRYVMNVIGTDQKNNPETPDISFTVDNIPISKWFNIIFRLQNKFMDVYINGTIVQRQVFEANPKQSFDDIQLCQNGGFAGMLSNLRYYDHALSVFDIESIVSYGPNLNPSSLTSKANTSYDYLSASWFRGNWSQPI